MSILFLPDIYLLQKVGAISKKLLTSLVPHDIILISYGTSQGRFLFAYLA